jgi:hypothetical protein
MDEPPKPEPNPFFHEFEQSIHAKYGSIIHACMELIPIGNALFETPVRHPARRCYEHGSSDRRRPLRCGSCSE